MIADNVPRRRQSIGATKHKNVRRLELRRDSGSLPQ